MPAHYIMATIRHNSHKTLINTSTILRIEPQVFRNTEDEFYVGSRIVYAHNATSEKVIEPPSDLQSYLTFRKGIYEEMKKNEEWILEDFINNPMEE